jgi:hypothetical protein
MSYQIDAAPVAADAGAVVQITTTGATVADAVVSPIVGAAHASFIMNTVVDNGTGMTTSTFLVTRNPQIAPVSAARVKVSMTNSSQRAFAISGAVLRVETSRPSLTATIPEDVTNQKRLAPGDSLFINVDINGLQTAQAGDTVTVKVYELPKTIAPDGSISERTQATVVFTITPTSTPVQLTDTTTKETRTWPSYQGAVPPDLAPFFRQ